MIRYIISRLGRAVISLIIILIVCFLLMRLLPVEGYYGDRSDKLSEETKQAILKDLGLLDPIHVQLYKYFKNIVTKLDFGKSISYYTGKPVWTIVAPKIGNSLKFGAGALAISIVCGFSLGIIMTMHKGKLIDTLGNGYILFISAVPAAVYYLFIQFVGTKLLNIGMIYSESNKMTWILPMVSMSLGGTVSYAMWIRRYMVDQINQDYVRLAKTKGLSNAKVMVNHILRNAVVPMAQYLPSSILFTISGSLYIESLYSIPGTGGLLVNAIKVQDNNLVQALVLLYAGLSVVGMLLGDITMAICDPRIKLVSTGGRRQ